MPSGAASDTPSGAVTEPVSETPSGATADGGGTVTDTSGAMADTSGAVTEPYLKENSEIIQERTPEPPPRCFCQKRNCGRKVEHVRPYNTDPAGFLAKHLGASMELRDVG